MQDVTGQNFGLLIAYVLPGVTSLWGLSFFSLTVRTWMSAPSANPPTVAGFLYLTIASVAAGLAVSTLRSMTIDHLHAVTGIRRPTLDYTRLQSKLGGFDLLVRHHYEYYKFHANMLIAVAFSTVARHAAKELLPPKVDRLDLLALFLMVVFFLGSRDNLRNYYQRARMLLGSRKDPADSPPSPRP